MIDLGVLNVAERKALYYSLDYALEGGSGPVDGEWTNAVASAAEKLYDQFVSSTDEYELTCADALAYPVMGLPLAWMMNKSVARIIFDSLKEVCNGRPSL